VDESNPRYEGWRVVAASGGAVFFASAPFHTFAVFLKPITEEFRWTREEASSAFGVLAMGAALAAPVLGRLLDRFGARRVILPSLAVSGAAVASLVALTPALWHLYVVFAVLGLATIGTSPVAHSRAVFSWFERRRGRALGCMLAGAALAGIILPPLIQWIVRTAGWRAAWLTMGSLTLAIGVTAAIRFIRERPAPNGITAHGTGFTVGEALRTRVFWTLVTVVFGSTLALNAATVHISALLTDRGVSASQAAFAISVMNGASLAGRLLTGLLLDRFHAARVSIVLLAIAATGTLILSGAETFAVAAVAAVFIGFGAGGEMDVTPYLLSRFFGFRAMSTLYGLNWTAWGLGAMVGPILMGRAFDATGSYQTVLVELSIVTLAASALMFTVPYKQAGSASVATASPTAG
jgi:MFS family permease